MGLGCYPERDDQPARYQIAAGREKLAYKARTVLLMGVGF